MKKILIVISLLIITSSVIAQQQIGIDTMVLTSSQGTSAGQNYTMNNEFRLVGSERLEWRQGSERTDYTITNVVGSWNDLTSQGEIELKVSLGSLNGSVFVYRKADGVLKLRIDMMRGSVNLVPFEFTISNITD